LAQFQTTSVTASAGSGKGEESTNAIVLVTSLCTSAFKFGNVSVDWTAGSNLGHNVRGAGLARGSGVAGKSFRDTFKKRRTFAASRQPHKGVSRLAYRYHVRSIDSGAWQAERSGKFRQLLWG
jgi:hypothetical protein